MTSDTTLDPLPPWNDGAAKLTIPQFVRTVATEGSRGYVPPAELIAVIDNDGTLWCEQPSYIQLAFALDRVKSLAPEHPEWQTTDPFRAVLHDDHAALAKADLKGLVELVMATSKCSSGQPPARGAA